MTEATNTVNITAGDGAVILSCPVVRGQLAFKALIAAIFVSPCVASFVFSMAGGLFFGKVAVAACTVGVGVLAGCLLVESQERLVLDGRGFTVTTKTVLGVVRRRRKPLPILVLVEPLWEDSPNPLSQTEWTASFIGHGGATHASVVLDGAGVRTLRQGLAQARLARVAFREIDRREQALSTACVRCGYDLTGVPAPRCPECGSEVTEAVMRLAKRAHTERRKHDVPKG